MQVVSPPVLLTKLCSQIDMPTWLICDRTPNETGKPAVTGDMRELPTRLRGALHCFDEAPFTRAGLQATPDSAWDGNAVHIVRYRLTNPLSVPVMN